MNLGYQMYNPQYNFKLVFHQNLKLGDEKAVRSGKPLRCTHEHLSLDPSITCVKARHGANACNPSGGWEREDTDRQIPELPSQIIDKLRVQ